MRARSSFVVGLLLAAGPALARPAKTAAPAEVGPTAEQLTSSVTPDGLLEVKVDLDRDGKAEIVNFYRERADTPRLLVRKDTDLNRDGRIDVRAEFDDSGQRVTEHMDGDFDGRADWVDHYINGKRTVSDIDTDFDGTFDLHKYYEQGVVRRKERDTNADGKTDFWEYLDPNGTVTKTGRDTDGDGKMDGPGQ